MADSCDTSSRQPHQKYDDDGEPILAEGVCNRSRLCRDVCIILFSLLFSFIIACPFVVIFVIYSSFKVAKSWRLYLTPAGIHYTEVGYLSPCCYKKMFIPLTDIECIYVKAIATVGLVIRVRVRNQSLLREYTPLCARILWGGNEYLLLADAENALEFTAAVEQQLSAAVEHQLSAAVEQQLPAASAVI